jgi:hypothetical protein
MADHQPAPSGGSDGKMGLTCGQPFYLSTIFQILAKQRFKIPCAMINMKHLNSLGHAAVKNQVMVETGDVP